MSFALRGEQGSAVIETAVIVPLLVLLMFLVVVAGRVGDAREVVAGVAAEAARAASVRDDPASAQRAAVRVARRSVSRRALACSSLDVDARVGSLAPGGSVRVRVSCGVSLSELTGLRLPGNRRISGSAAAVVDRYRGR